MRAEDQVNLALGTACHNITVSNLLLTYCLPYKNYACILCKYKYVIIMVHIVCYGVFSFETWFDVAFLESVNDAHEQLIHEEQRKHTLSMLHQVCY